MAKKEKEKDEDDDRDEVEDEIVIVTDNKENLDTPPTSEQHGEDDVMDALRNAQDKDDVKGGTKGKKKAKDEDEDEDDEEDDEDDERLGASEESEREKEAKAKVPHKTRRQRRKDAENRLRNENRFFELRNEQLEKQIQALADRQDQTEATTLEREIASRKQLIARADSVIAEAITKNKGTEATQATAIRDGLRDELKELEEAKEEQEVARERIAKGGGRAKVPAAVVSRSQKWMSENDWFDPDLGDTKSKIARVVDLSLHEDGLNPATDEYWKEFDKRLIENGIKKAGKKARKDDADEDEDDEEDEKPARKQPKQKAAGGPRFRSGNGAGRTLGENEVFLSRERIAAMKEAGVWDDPILKQKQLKKYREWDKANADHYKD